MTGPKIACFSLIALLATATCNAQHATQHWDNQACATGHCNGHAGCSGCGGIGCAIFKCSGHHYFPRNCLCPKPYTYDQAAALWGNYCYGRSAHGGCLSHGGCHTGVCNSLGDCGIGCNHLGWTAGGCRNGLGHQHIYNNLFRNSAGCCDNGCLQPANCSHHRHGMNLFQGVKSHCQNLLPGVSNGCGCDAAVQPNCGCDSQSVPAKQPQPMNTELSGYSR